MGYQRSFTKKVSVHYSGSVSYPPSQSGGSVPYSGTAYETVNVTVYVDSDPVEESVAQCRHSVDALTGSVAATEAAEIISIDKKAKQIGSTIIAGFFKTIRSDISQQINELANRVESEVLNLQQLAKRCSEKQFQMEKDYIRIANRYEKIFTELNHELENRIYELDKPTFDFKRKYDAHHGRFSTSDMISTSTVAAKESGTLQNQISVSLAKRRTLEALEMARNFLTTEKQTKDTINRCMVEGSEEGTLFLPILYMDAVDAPNVRNVSVFSQDDMQDKSAVDKVIEQSLSGRQWAPKTSEEKEAIRRFFIEQMQKEYPQQDGHSARVREKITKLFNI